MSFPRQQHRKTIVVGILFAVAVIILSFSLFKPSGETGFCKKFVFEALSPLQNAVNGTFASIGDVWKRYIFLVGLQEENKKLRALYLSEAEKNNQYRETNLECMRLRKLIGLKEQIEHSTVAARVVGRERSSLFKTVLINKGSSDGMAIGRPVVATGGVVGKIIDVSWNVSKVLLLVDYNSNIDCMIQGTRTQGILQGRGDKICKLKYVQRSEVVSVGEVVVTSGLAGLFPKGLLVGSVDGVTKDETKLFQDIRVKPEVDIDRLEEVLVIMEREKTP